MKKLLLILGFTVSISAHAGTYQSTPTPSSSDLTPWHYIIGMGYSNYSDMLANDGDTFLGRLGLSRDISTVRDVLFSLELAVQTGASMRLQMTSSQELALGNTAVQTFINPFVDLLVMVATPIKIIKINQIPGKTNKVSGQFNQIISKTNQILAKAYQFTGFVKGGIAYRQMHFDRDTINSLQEIAPELQAGLSLNLTDKTTLALGYQGIFSGNVGLRITNAPASEGSGLARAKNIATQNNALLTLSMKA